MQTEFTFSTKPRSFINITRKIAHFVNESDIGNGLCNIFLKHTSASLILSENADPDVLYDLENYMKRLVQDDHPDYRHTAEGFDDMSAHIRSVLTTNSLSIPVTNGQLNLGAWQGLFLWEHRAHEFQRTVVVTLI